MGHTFKDKGYIAGGHIVGGRRVIQAKLENIPDEENSKKKVGLQTDSLE